MTIVAGPGITITGPSTVPAGGSASFFIFGSWTSLYVNPPLDSGRTTGIVDPYLLVLTNVTADVTISVF